MIRYADDLLVLHPDRSVIEQCRQLLEQWLSDIGLQLKSSKTRIAHTLKAVDAKAGFDFLGFDVRQYKAGKYNTAVIATGTIYRPLGFKTLDLLHEPDFGTSFQWFGLFILAFAQEVY